MEQPYFGTFGGTTYALVPSEKQSDRRMLRLQMSYDGKFIDTSS